jgi:RNA polymerase sigma-70 factor (ECF subfamily)
VSALSDYLQGRGIQEEAALDKAELDKIIRSCVEGSESAFESLVELYQARVYALALRLMKDPDEAEEVAQEVFLSCFRNIGSFRMESSLSTWLHRITVNMAKNRWKHQQRRMRDKHESLDAPRLEENPQKREPKDPRPDPRQESAGREMRDRLDAAVASLPEEQRIVVVMRFLQDLQYEEIAEALDLSMGTVKSRINRGRKRLHELLKDAIEA